MSKIVIAVIAVMMMVAPTVATGTGIVEIRGMTNVVNPHIVVNGVSVVVGADGIVTVNVPCPEGIAKVHIESDIESVDVNVKHDTIQYVSIRGQTKAVSSSIKPVTGPGNNTVIVEPTEPIIEPPNDNTEVEEETPEVIVTPTPTPIPTPTPTPEPTKVKDNNKDGKKHTKPGKEKNK